MKIAPEILPSPLTTLAVWVACVFTGLVSAQVEPPLPIAGSRAQTATVPPVAGAESSPIPFQVPRTIPPQGPPLPGSVADGSPISRGINSKISTSNSGDGQFVIHGKDLQTRSPFSARCAEVAERLKRLLRDEEPWVLPIVVALKTAPDLNLAEPPVKTSISKITTGGFHLQITVQIRPDLQPAALDAEITRILIAERILRNHAEITTKRSMVLPDWLLTGISQAMSFRDRSRPSAVFAAIFRSGKIYGIEEILDTAPGELDALSRTLYETSCCALVLALLDQVDGPMRLRTFLSMLAVDSRDDRALLNFCFPTLALSSSSLNKWWSLQMASLATPTVFETLGPTDTKSALADALTLRYESPSDSAPKPRIASAASKPSAPTPVSPAEDEKLADEKKPGFLGRLIGMGASGEKDEKKEEKKDDAEKKAKAATLAEKPKEPKTEVAAETTADEKKPGFLGRMFGANGDDEKPKEPKAEEPKKIEAKASEAAKNEPKEKEKSKVEPEKKAPPSKPEPVAESKPKSKTEVKPGADEETSEPKKRGFLGRMFGGGGDSKDEKAAEPEKADENKDKKKKTDAKKSDDQSSILPDRLLDVTALFDDRTSQPAMGPVLAQDSIWNIEGIWSAFFSSGIALWEAWASESGRPVILGFGKKKKPEEGEPEEEKPKAEEKKKEEAKPKPSKKKEEKKEPEKEADKAKKEKAKPEPAATSTPPPAPKPTATSAKPRLVPVSVPIEEFSVILKRKDRDAILDRSAKALAALAQRGNVLFRPLINEYIAVIADLQVDKTKDMAARLSALKVKTEEIYARAKAVEDHLDWFEASETQNYSGTFEDYLRLPEQIQKELPPREDPIAKYLDEVEAQGLK